MDRQNAPREFNPRGLGTKPLPEGSWPIRSVGLDLTGRCNMVCRYCLEAATLPPRPPMSEQMVDAALSLLAPAEPGCRRSIRLGSGEPLLAIPMMRRIVERIALFEEPRPRPYVTTNGTLLTPETRDWLIETGWDVKISLDGPKSIHDRWRLLPDGLGTFDRIEESVVDLAHRLPSDRYGVNAVLCRGAHPRAVFEGLADLGVRSIELVPVAHRDPAVLPSPEDVARYEDFVVDGARRHLEGDYRPDLFKLAGFRRYVYRLMGYYLRGARCGAGRNFVAVAYDGAVYPCLRFVGAERHKLGQLPQGIDLDAYLAFQRGPGRPHQQRAACSRCWAAPLCGGPCYAVSEMIGEGDGEPLDLHCAYELATARAAVWLVDQLRRHDPDRLLELLPFDPGDLLA